MDGQTKKFQLDPLEPRLLLSADPLMGEAAASLGIGDGLRGPDAVEEVRVESEVRGPEWTAGSYRGENPPSIALEPT